MDDTLGFNKVKREFFSTPQGGPVSRPLTSLTAHLLSLALVLGTVTPVCHGGALGDFEQKVETQNAERSKERHRAQHDDDDDDEGCGLNLLCHLITGLVEVTVEVGADLVSDAVRRGGVVTTVEFATEYPDEGRDTEAALEADPLHGAIPVDEARLTEGAAQTSAAVAPLITFGHLHLATQQLDDGVRGERLELLAGLEFLHARLRQSRFVEHSAGATDRLALTQMDAGFNLGALGHKGGAVGLGIGLVQLKGDQEHWGSEVTLPLTWGANDLLGVALEGDYITLGEAHLVDLDAALNLRREHLLLRLGYRSLRNGDEVLEGPYVGVGLTW